MSTLAKLKKPEIVSGASIGVHPGQDGENTLRRPSGAANGVLMAFLKVGSQDGIAADSRFHLYRVSLEVNHG